MGLFLTSIVMHGVGKWIGISFALSEISSHIHLLREKLSLSDVPFFSTIKFCFVVNINSFPTAADT